MKADHLTKAHEEGADVLPRCERLKENWIAAINENF
jgi:hypothetical protein